MAGNRIPGPTSQTGHSLSSGTLPLSTGFAPGPLLRLRKQHAASVAPVAEQLSVEVYSFAKKHIADIVIRAKYLAAAATCTKELERLCTRNTNAATEVKPVVDETCRQIRQLNELVGVSNVAAVYQLLVTVKEQGGSVAIELADPGFSKRSEPEKQKACLNVINTLASSNTQLLVPAEIGKGLLVATKSLAWTIEATRMPDVFQYQPKARSFKRPIAKQQPSKPQSRPTSVQRPAPAPKKEAPDNVDQDAQAATLIAAAKDGVPFCEECEKAKRKREANAAAVSS